MITATLDLDQHTLTPLTDLADLEDKGHRMVDALGGDIEPADKTRELLRRLQSEKKDTFYSDVLFYLTSERFPESQAVALWRHILDHKYLVSRNLGRNVGIRVAAIDYLLNVRKLLITPRVVNSSDYKRTLRLARTDALTGLYNRRTFMDQTARVLEAAGRLKAPVTLLMADLDHFKPFNDGHGHQAGDLLLQEVARLVRGGVRASDLAARYGGDELALLLPKAGRAEAVAVAEKIRQQIEENCQEVGVTISLGAAEFPSDGSTREDLIAAADDLLYRAKEFGGNKVCWLHPTAFALANDDPKITQVALVGDFNNWSTRRHPLEFFEGRWARTVSLKPGRYRYKFFVNTTQWWADPSSPHYESDGFGGQCSVVVVK
jgi:diguanylate cyclase (GGDEF)-like protein